MQYMGTAIFGSLDLLHKSEHFCTKLRIEKQRQTFWPHKGQLISECPFDFPKNHRKICQISAKNMKGVEIIKIKTMYNTTIIYI